MNNQTKNLQTGKKYNLEERTAQFAETIIDLMKKLPNNSINRRMIEQIVGSAVRLEPIIVKPTRLKAKKILSIR